MGIKDYHKWFKKNYPTCFKNKWFNFYDHVYIDINYLLHYVHYGVINQSQIIYKFFSLIERLILEFNPTKSIVFAADGQAPIAKLLLQRERRILMARDTSELSISPLIYTPGTEFMETIEEKIKIFAKKFELVYNIKIDYMIDKEGEAEMKLKYKMMENIENNKSDTHILISSDADIIAMFGSYEYSNYYNIFICSEIKDICVISFGELMKCHCEKYGFSDNFNLDFTLLSIILGNDYLPKISFCDLDKLWDTYKIWVGKYKGGLIDNNMELNVDFFVEILNGIINRTKLHLLKKFNFETFNDNSNLYKNYMEGLLWCLNMYKNGKCIRYNYMYQYDEAPHPFGLILNIKKNKDISKFDGNILYPSLNKNLYATLVLPKKAVKLIKEEKYHVFSDKHPILYEEELCEECMRLHKEKQKYKKNTENENNEICREIIQNIKLHKLSHKNIAIGDIEEISAEFSETFFN